MKTNLLDSSAKRVSIAVAVLALVVVAAAGIYLFTGNSAAEAVNGPKIIAAARAYTRALVQNHEEVPHSVALQTLVEKNFLQNADIGSLQGLDAKIFLTAGTNGPPVLMTVHMPDGGTLLLLADGTSRTTKP
jgi:hypothetical protein